MEQLALNTCRSSSTLLSSLLVSCPSPIKIRPRDSKGPWGNFQPILLLHITSQPEGPCPHCIQHRGKDTPEGNCKSSVTLAVRPRIKPQASIQRRSCGQHRLCRHLCKQGRWGDLPSDPQLQAQVRGADDIKRAHRNSVQGLCAKQPS